MSAQKIFFKREKEPGIVAHTCNPIIQEAEAGGLL